MIDLFHSETLTSTHTQGMCIIQLHVIFITHSTVCVCYNIGLMCLLQYRACAIDSLGLVHFISLYYPDVEPLLFMSSISSTFSFTYSYLTWRWICSEILTYTGQYFSHSLFYNFGLCKSTILLYIHHQVKKTAYPLMERCYQLIPNGVQMAHDLGDLLSARLHIGACTTCAIFFRDCAVFRCPILMGI